MSCENCILSLSDINIIFIITQGISQIFPIWRDVKRKGEKEKGEYVKRMKHSVGLFLTEININDEYTSHTSLKGHF